MTAILVVQIVAFIADTAGPNTTAVYLGAFGAFAVSVATAVGAIRSLQIQKEQLNIAREEAFAQRQRADEAAEALERSSSFLELEKALPGLGSLVDRWQKEATQERALRIEAMEKAVADHMMILRLQSEVQELKDKLAASEAETARLKSRVAVLEATVKDIP